MPNDILSIISKATSNMGCETTPPIAPCKDSNNILYAEELFPYSYTSLRCGVPTFYLGMLLQLRNQLEYGGFSGDAVCTCMLLVRFSNFVRKVSQQSRACLCDFLKAVDAWERSQTGSIIREVKARSMGRGLPPCLEYNTIKPSICHGSSGSNPTSLYRQCRSSP